MKLSACEISHLHVRGHNVSLIIGDRAVSAEEAEGLVREFAAVYGHEREPAYVSRDGWQAITRRGPADDQAASAAEIERLAAELKAATERGDALQAELDAATAAASDAAKAAAGAAADTAAAKTGGKGKA